MIKHRGIKGNLKDLITIVENHPNHCNIRYDWSKAVYIGSRIPLSLGDPEHGFWNISPDNLKQGHLHRLRANKIVSVNQTITFDQYINRSLVSRGPEYTVLKYTSMKDKVFIRNEVTEEEYWINADNHLIKGKENPHRSGQISRLGLSWLLSIDPEQNFITPYIEPTLNINNRKRRVDGYDPNTNTVYQFHGNYWHGLSKDGKEIIDQARYNNTLLKDQEIRNNGYNLVVMWQHEWTPTDEDWNRIPPLKNLTQQFQEKLQKANLKYFNDAHRYTVAENSSYVRCDVCMKFIDNETNEEFEKTPSSLLSGYGHILKNFNKRREVFIEKARKVHGNLYDYSKVIYVDSKTKVCIIDIELGIEFWQSPNKHLLGQGHPARRKFTK